MPSEEERDARFDISWLFEGLKKAWGDWVDPSTIGPGLSYTKKVSPNFRIININSVYGYNMNW